ncbi:hypothetical protein BCR33DRAFT_715032 [Rhizoclosmatium globosum]|uniref:C3H1-type domain-containing protein n=1 Tax=Rhizoclosmatium globosum TaxID=329046 RepID=A0A1Y2CJZ9_9FUNG|nr:hypothetical protein BCR33DRAFT_715032 [Rhizoclosmatium globosum]|eukprot:ORY47287.1 hypothetical protein BCR33DRAFT_715032 [Rhizoclosmatium globosum]
MTRDRRSDHIKRTNLPTTIMLSDEEVKAKSVGQLKALLIAASSYSDIDFNNPQAAKICLQRIVNASSTLERRLLAQLFTNNVSKDFHFKYVLSRESGALGHTILRSVLEKATMENEIELIADLLSLLRKFPVDFKLVESFTGVLKALQSEDMTTGYINGEATMLREIWSEALEQKMLEQEDAMTRNVSAANTVVPKTIGKVPLKSILRTSQSIDLRTSRQTTKPVNVVGSAGQQNKLYGQKGEKCGLNDVATTSINTFYNQDPRNDFVSLKPHARPLTPCTVGRASDVFAQPVSKSPVQEQKLSEMNRLTSLAQVPTVSVPGPSSVDQRRVNRLFSNNEANSEPSAARHAPTTPVYKIIERKDNSAVKAAHHMATDHGAGTSSGSQSNQPKPSNKRRLEHEEYSLSQRVSKYSSRQTSEQLYENPQNNSKKEICYFWKRGRCEYGKYCRNKHE